jgi:hypothetical protein
MAGNLEELHGAELLEPLRRLAAYTEVTAVALVDQLPISHSGVVRNV